MTTKSNIDRYLKQDAAARRLRIARQKTLLAGRKKEYEVFGTTPLDLLRDRDISHEIALLEASLETDVRTQEEKECPVC